MTMTDAPIDIVDRDRVVVWPSCDKCGVAAGYLFRKGSLSLTFCVHHAQTARICNPLNTAGWESYRLLR